MGAPAEGPASGQGIRNPIMIVAGFSEVPPAIDWVSRLLVEGPPRVTFVHIIDTNIFMRGFEAGGSSLVELIGDAERDGKQILETLRTLAPESMSVTTRLLKAPLSLTAQIMHLIEEVPCCDAVVVCTHAGVIGLGSTARTIRRLRAKSSVPVVVLDEGPRACRAVLYSR